MIHDEKYYLSMIVSLFNPLFDGFSRVASKIISGLYVGTRKYYILIAPSTKRLITEANNRVFELI